VPCERPTAEDQGRDAMTILSQLTAAMGNDRGVVAADKLCEACVDLLAVDAAALSLVFDGANNGTLGSSGPKARLYDELQFTYGEGPCLETVTARNPIIVVDLADPRENRWPAYRTAMLAHHIRGIYALPVLVGGQYAGALDLFRAEPGVLSEETLAGAVLAADLAELPVLDIISDYLQVPMPDPDSDAWAELSTLARAEVSQATGMLIAQLDVGAAEALVRLRAHAYASGRTASDVARDIIDRRLRLEAD
jgi:GAF domain-containing protein/ANTAR domain-containing protein